MNTNRRPNILYILSDDQGAWAMGCAGNQEISTPNLDRIAQNGMRMENFFCVSPVCSPARASLMTGAIPSRHGVLDWLRGGNVDRERFAGKQTPHVSYADEEKPIQYLAGQITYTDILAQNGYTCALSGKWHLGDSVTPQHGFQYWYTIGKGGCYYYHPDMVENGDITVEDGKYVTDLITDKALDFLEELSAGEAPFYLSVHYTAPHSPWEADQHPAEWIGFYEGCPFESTPDLPDHPWMTQGPVYGTPQRKSNLRGYYAAVSAMDQGIGKLLDRLEEKGMLEGTLIIFNGDNGMNMGHHGIWGKGNGTYPMNMYDSSVKVPFLISYPPVIPKGSVCTAMLSAYDFFPTLLELLGLDTSQTSRLPGSSFAPVLRGEAPLDGDGDVVVYDEYGPVRMIRTRRYKYIHRYPYGPNEFYDLERDPDEADNRIEDPAFQEEIRALRGRMERWFNDYADPDVDGSREGVTGSGQLCSAGIYAQRTEKYATPGPNC